MQIVIDISEEDYERLKQYEKAPFCSLTSRVYEAIANGTPLPKGHEDLIDRSCLYDFRKYLQTCPKSCNEDDEIWFTSEEIDNRIKQYSAIIEADKSESECQTHIMDGGIQR